MKVSGVFLAVVLVPLFCSCQPAEVNPLVNLPEQVENSELVRAYSSLWARRDKGITLLNRQLEVRFINYYISMCHKFPDGNEKEAAGKFLGEIVRAHENVYNGHATQL